MLKCPGLPRQEQRETVAPSVPSRNTAAARWSAQSPLLGTPCGARYDCAASRKCRPSNVRPATGARSVPSTESSVCRAVATSSPFGEKGVRLAQKIQVGPCIPVRIQL